MGCRMKKRAFLIGGIFLIIAVYVANFLTPLDTNIKPERFIATKVETRKDPLKKLKRSNKKFRKAQRSEGGKAHRNRKFANSFIWNDLERESRTLKLNGQEYRYISRIVARTKEIKSRNLVFKNKSYYFYTKMKGDLNNIFLNPKTQEINIWTGEVLIQGTHDFSEVIGELESFELIKRYGGFYLLKFTQEENILEEIESLKKIPSVLKINLDLKKQRLIKI